MRQATYKINDKKNAQAYDSVLLGVLLGETEPIARGVKLGADLTKITIDFVNFSTNFDDEDDYRSGSKFISLEEFARMKSSGLVYNEIIKNLKNYNEFKVYSVLKLMMGYSSNFSKWAVYKKRPHVDFTKEMEIIKQTVNSKNVNQAVEIYSYSSPLDRSYKEKKIKTSLLNYACYTQNYQVVDYLISIGANVNCLVKETSHRGASVVKTIMGTPAKGDQSVSLAILMKLIENKASFNYQNEDGITGWEYAINKFKIPQLMTLFKNYQPDDLKVIEKIRNKSPNLYNMWSKQSKGFSKYPLINDIFKYENRKILVASGFDKIPNVNKFFTNKSMKEALKKRYGTESKNFTKSFTDKVFIKSSDEEDSDKTVTVNPACFISADILKSIFLDIEKPNPSDFVEIFSLLKKDESFGIADEDEYSSLGKKLSRFLNKHFQSFQIKELLTNKELLNDYRYGFNETEDILNMYFKHEKEFSETISKTAFKNLNSLEKIHDVLSAEIEILDQKNYSLNQEKHYPKLLNVPKAKMPEGYSIKVASENHELIRWGAMMGHCIGGGDYAENAASGECILLAIAKDDTPKYAIEISNKGSLLQVQGKSRSVPEKPVLETFVKELKKIGVLNQKESAKRWIR